MWCDGRRGPEVGEVAVVPEDELGEDDVLDDGVEQEVGQPHEASEDGAEEEAWKERKEIQFRSDSCYTTISLESRKQ